ncbi:D-aminoacylase [Bordetella genomosp. 9]|uniref:N-acyl-D-amino-acid deacylase family protein n=1 Tax=Bordetella genomosp. 9 TaxID=1416803 RepID=UPI000A28FAF8|nr:D-aminoacylase [Bordetella genomosp. 9]ARP91272.1 D-aminoacylase [Bordetella genomosp. 9]
MPDSNRYDVLIRGGTVVDGTGAPRRQEDLALRDGRIAAMGDLRDADARHTIDAQGLIVAPGFIDSHAHDDYAVIETPDMAFKVLQGVTTVVNGNCGLSLAPLVTRERPPAPLDLLGDAYHYRDFATYRAAVDAADPAVNVAAMIGHSTLRVRHMADLQRAATRAEIAAMRADLADGLRAGAIGMSTGTFYPPAAHAPAEEIIEIGAPLRELGGVYATHLRDEGDEILEAIEESLRIGAALQAPIIFSHHKLVGTRNHGRSEETLAVLAQAAARQPLCADCYPYAASSTMLRPERVEICDRIMVAWSAPHPEASGRDLRELAREWGCSAREAAERLLPAGAVYFIMDEGDVRRILSWPETMVGSDGLPKDIRPHPRLWGTFPRVLGHYARDVGLFSLEAAVHKMTGLTAAKFGLSGRGVLRAGNIADIVVFDAARIADTATFDAPEGAPLGIEYVLLGGRMTVTHGTPTGARGGRYIGRSA